MRLAGCGREDARAQVGGRTAGGALLALHRTNPYGVKLCIRLYSVRCASARSQHASRRQCDIKRQVWQWGGAQRQSLSPFRILVCTPFQHPALALSASLSPSPIRYPAPTATPHRPPATRFEPPPCGPNHTLRPKPYPAAQTIPCGPNHPCKLYQPSLCASVHKRLVDQPITA